jgi:hypothetical protein
MKQKTKIQLHYIFQNCLRTVKTKKAMEKIKEDYKILLEIIEKNKKSYK